MSAPPVPDIAAGNAAFSTAMRAFHAWEAGELQDALNAYEATRLLSTTTTSVTSNTIGTGDKTFTVSAGLGFVAGQSINVANTANPANYMSGIVKSYSSTTLVVTVLTTGGSGTLSAWSIALGLTGGGASLGTNTFTGVQNFAQGTDIASAATINLTTATGNIVTVTGTVATSAVTLGAGMTRLVRAAAAWPLTYNATTNNITGGVSTTLAAGDFVFYQNLSGVVYGMIIKANGRAVVEASAPTAVTVRQAVQYGALTATGQPDLITQAQIGATVATGVTMAGTWMASVGNGFNTDGSQRNLNRVRTASLNVPSLNASATNYIWYDTVSDTAGFVTVADAFQAGGTIPVTNNQYTYDYLNHIMYLGNGTTATQSNRIIVAEVDTNATVVTAIRVRAYRGEAASDEVTIPAANTAVTFSHNLGKVPFDYSIRLRCKTAEFGYAVGDEVDYTTFIDGDGARIHSAWASNPTIGWIGSAAAPFVKRRDTTGGIAITPASWRLVFRAER